MELALKNIGKLHEANIRCPGFTVIAGENNTGKSTIGRALYLYLKSFYGLDTYIRSDMVEALRRNLADPMEQFDLMCRRYSNAGRRHKLTRAEEIRRHFAEQIIDDYYDDLDSAILELGSLHAALYDISDVREIRDSYPAQYDNWYGTTIQTIRDVQRIDGSEIGKRKVTRLTEAFFSGDIISFGKEEDVAEIHVTKGGYENSLSFLRNRKDGSDNCIGLIQNGSVTESVLYIDSPKMVDELYELSKSVKANLPKYLKNYLAPAKWQGVEEVNNAMETSVEVEQRKRLLNDFSEAIRQDAKGYLVVNPATELEFRQTGEKRSVKIRNLSNGVKALSLLEYAIGNGTLKKGDYLILDEPEINLHPAWQVEYARLLVMLQQLLDLNIILTTHTPYFLHAIEVYAAKAGIADKVAYYAASNQSDGSAVVKDVSACVDEIYQQLAAPIGELENVQYGS